MHILQPPHKRLTQEEAKKVLDKYNIGLIQLPIISLSDPALPEGCNKGDVIEIKRESGLYYRVVA